MLKQAIDFFEESQDIYKILSNISENCLDTTTQFKHWSFNDIIRHLHVWNIAAYNSLQGDIEWETFNHNLQTFFKEGKKLSDFEKSITKNFVLVALQRAILLLKILLKSAVKLLEI